MDDRFSAWFSALEARHRATLSFQEIRRALQALSSLYVERRERLAAGSVFDGAGKRAAFALYYGPLHFLLLREIVRCLGAAARPPVRLLDLGCGTGAAGAAWAMECPAPPLVAAVDQEGWAIAETRWTLARFGLRGRVQRANLSFTPLPAPPSGILAAFAINELDDAARQRLLPRFLEAHRNGSQVLIVEPLARRALPWWDDWANAFIAAAGRADEWRFPAELPETLALLDKAAGLDHRQLTGRSLWLAGAR